MYDIRKGWPSNGAIDEVLAAAPGETVTDGMIVSVTDLKAKPADFSSGRDGIPAFIIGKEDVRGTFTGIMSQCVIEVDAEHYVAGSYAAGDHVTAQGGKFAAGTEANAVGRVLSFDAVSGRLRVLWFEAR